MKKRKMSNGEYEREFQRKIGSRPFILRGSTQFKSATFSDFLARDIKRLWNLQGKLENQENIEMLRWVRRSIGERFVRLADDPETAVDNLKKLTLELQRPHRTDHERRFINAYFGELYCNEEPPTYKTIKKKFEAAGLRCSEKNLSRMNKGKLHLRMRGRGRPRKEPPKK